MRRIHVGLLLLAIPLLAGCTTRYQVRGTENALGSLPPGSLVFDPGATAQEREECRARQTSMEHQSVETYDGFSIGVLEISDDGAINPSQKQQVMDMVEEKTRNSGLLVVYVHGWHHSSRVCDRDIACFRNVLAGFKQWRAGKAAQNGVKDEGEVVGVYIGWRGESFAHSGWNVATLWERKRVAEHIGRTAGKEILVELHDLWARNDDLTMVTVGHSLGGAFVFSAVKGKLTGNVSDIELQKIRTYRVVRTQGDRVEALQRKVKALRAGFGDLVVLVNPAIEASEYKMFDRDLKDQRVTLNRRELVAKKLPYDKKEPYDPQQMPVLMTVASEADTAVSRFFPPARLIEAFLTFQWVDFARASWTAMGRYGPQVTHQLTYTGDGRKDENLAKPIDKECDCTKMTGSLPPLTKDLDLAAEIQDFDGFKLEVVPKRLEKRGWDSSSPYLVVETDKTVIDEHSDIFNPIFLSFLQRFIDAYDVKQDKLFVSKDIAGIRAVDAHVHARPAPVDPADDPLLPDGIYLGAGDKRYLKAWHALYGYPDPEVEIDHLHTAPKRRSMASEEYPACVLDLIGVDFALVPDRQLGPGLIDARFRRIAPANALLHALPPDRFKGTRPGSLAEYSDLVRTTLRQWKEEGIVAVSFTVPGEQSLVAASPRDAERLYRELARGRELSSENAAALASFLFREVAREAGRAGLVVQVVVPASQPPGDGDPLEFASVFDDPELQDTRFVVVGGGWPAARTGELLRRDNVHVGFAKVCAGYLDDDAPEASRRASRKLLREWLEQYPEKVLFGSEAAYDPAAPLAGWEEGEWLAASEARGIVADVLREMLAELQPTITRDQAVELARMVLRTNALRLYGLPDDDDRMGTIPDDRKEHCENLLAVRSRS